MKKALFIGRFQPFHKGHLNAIKIAEKNFKVIIGIGSSEEKNTIKNPFSFEERKEMISKILSNEIIRIPDMESNKEWTEHIIKTIDFDVVITGDNLTNKCFFNKKKIIKPDFLDIKKYNGTNIRKLISHENEWETFVPEQVVDTIKSINE